MRRVLAFLLASACLIAQDRSTDRRDPTLVSRIKTEAFDNSTVKETLSYLTDRYGPRLTASPELREAADWAMKRLQSYGIENVRLEEWGPFGRSWALKQYSIEMIEPRYAVLDAAPLAWSDHTGGPITADVVYAPYGSPRQTADPSKQREDLDRYIAQWKGKLRGKIAVIARTGDAMPSTEPAFRRLTDKDLQELAAAPEPAARLSDVSHLVVPDDPAEERRFFQRLPASVAQQFADARTRVNVSRAKFFHDEGVAAILNTTGGSEDGLIFVQAAGPYKASDSLAPPTFAVSREQLSRITRLAEKKVAVRMRINLQADISSRDEDAFNIVGEIPGGARRDEFVMIGAHFDSWHGATGATDNGAGSAVMIEVMRILKALNLRLDRSVRIALWSGEEQGLLGSKAYVKAHFGDPETMKLTEAHAKLTGYFNLDNGSGRIRGVYLQGNDAMRPIFQQWLEPFRDLGVSTISIRNTGGTDHLSFDAVGLPGFQFIQDPLDYSTITHHSNMDTLDHVQEADLMQAAAVIATVVYEAANRQEMLPRKALPKPGPKAALPEVR
jgi:hypothetical protein